MNRHSKDDLRQMQSLPLEAKIIMTERRIRDWIDYWNGDVYVSFSGGKDSTVLKHIVDQMGYDIPAVFVNTGLEYPEIQNFVREIKAGKYECFNNNVEIIRPEMRFDEVIQMHGYPVISKSVSNAIEGARNSIKKGQYSVRLCRLGIGRNEYGGLQDDGKYDYEGNLENSKFMIKKWRFLADAPFKISASCCDTMKKRPAHKYGKETGRKPIIATMASESTNRENAWFKNGCNGFNAKKPQSTPMAFWTEQDILHYIKKFNVPYCPVYGEIQVKANAGNIEGQINMIDYLGCYEPEDTLETTGCSRTGCMFCMFGCHLEKSPNRFQRMKKTHPKQYEYCMNQLGLKEVLEYIGVPYE
jgi:3'-phosphoadenosine 5'-phosphosulfate sulfotransferase (PAPS reductase)/FAD synthetase